MRAALKAMAGWSTRDWLRIVAFLALPNCGFTATPGPPLDEGPPPHISAVFCDIEDHRECASPTHKMMGIPLTSAAIALNQGTPSSVVGLDFSPAALAACPAEGAQAVIFATPFPDGMPVCLNCFQIGPAPPPPDPAPPYADPDKVCVAKCDENFGSNCTGRARASTNHPDNPDPCFVGACLNGILRSDFVDPRRVPEPIVWQDLDGVSATGNNLTRTRPATSQFDSGAVSAQWIRRGDAYVEFSTSTATVTQVLGLSEIPAGCSEPCPDPFADLNHIGFAILLNSEGRVHVVENGTIIQGPDPTFSFGTYAAGERFRITLADNSTAAGDATVHYSRITGPCRPGIECPETVFYTHVGAPAHYPLRVDTTFFNPGATLTDVRTVRIQ
jgi:hypothetical protein